MKILFVCMGNICRSPTAEGVFRSFAESALSEQILKIDSAGTIGYHAGENADLRAISAAARRNYDISNIISRKVEDEDFDVFDLILAMDKENYTDLLKQARSSGNSHHADKVKLLLEFSGQDVYQEVPDPYYGGTNGFDLVIDLIEDASQGLLQFVKQHIRA